MATRNIYRFILLMVFAIVFMACKKDGNVTLPEVATYLPQYVASTEATVGCTVDSDGGADIICGIYIGTSQNPDKTGTQFQIATDIGAFLGQVTGLTPNVQYYVRAYAKNTKGEGLGEEISFTTPEKVSDIEDNLYNTVKIGGQMWMAENLRTTTYNNGEVIGATASPGLDISAETTPKYQWAYDGSVGNIDSYGRLYTWFTVTDSRKVCPAGWHVPSDAEWTSLETVLGGFTIAGSKLKEIGNSHWIAPYNLDATNESCFRALPGGYRNMTGGFSYLENNGYWWSSSEADLLNSWIRSLSVQSGQALRSDYIKKHGLAVRCIKD